MMMGPFMVIAEALVSRTRRTELGTRRAVRDITETP